MKLERKFCSKVISLSGLLATSNLLHPCHFDSGGTCLYVIQTWQVANYLYLDTSTTVL